MKSRSLILPGRIQGPLLRIAVLVASLAALSTGLTISPVQAAVPPQLAQGFSEIVKNVTPAVVNIAVTGGERMGPGRRPLPPGPFGGPPGGGPPGMQPPFPGPPPGGPRRPDLSAGSGVIIDASGYIVTNNHVVENASEITVTLSDRREFRATVVGTDPKTDLAVIKIEVDNLPALKWADYEALQVGDLVLAAGSPFGLTSTVTLGIISALGRGNVGITDYEDFIQTDAAINPGNSGGALVNMNGDLIGINTAIFSRTGGSEGIGFAIPSSIAVDIVDSLRRTGKVVRGWMGIAIQEVTPALAKSFQLDKPHSGVLISEVNESGPSAAAGLKRGDVIIAYDRKAVENVNQLRNLVARTHVGNKAEVKVIRDGKEEVLVIKIGERPSDELLVARRRPTPAPEAESAELPDNVLAALRVEALDAAMRSQLNVLDTTKGVVINHVEPGSPAEAAGLLRGDVVQEVNHRVIRDLDDYQEAASKIKKDDMVVLLLSRRGNNLFVAVNPE